MSHPETNCPQYNALGIGCSYPSWRRVQPQAQCIPPLPETNHIPTHSLVVLLSLLLAATELTGLAVWLHCYDSPPPRPIFEGGNRITIILLPCRLDCRPGSQQSPYHKYISLSDKNRSTTDDRCPGHRILFPKGLCNVFFFAGKMDVFFSSLRRFLFDISPRRFHR